MINIITTATTYLAISCDKIPLFITVMIFLAMLAFTMVEGTIETLIFGDRFEHWLDPLFMCIFIAWGAYAIYICAVLKVRDPGSPPLHTESK